MKKLTLLMAAIHIAAIAVSAQTWSVGPQAGYTITVATPSQVSQQGAPSRVVLGVVAQHDVSDRLSIRVSGAYRMEDGGFLSAYQAGSVRSDAPSTMIDVVDPTTGKPAVGSTVSTSAIELMAGIVIPVANLDTSGARFSLSLNVLGDMMLSGSQQDDYTDIPGYVGERLRTFTYVPHVGVGAALGAGLRLPLASSTTLLMDLYYIFREPRTVEVEENGVQLANTVDVGWLVGRGLRLSAAVTFDL